MFHLTSSGCALVLQKDLEYWGIDELMMEPCCALKYYPEIETCVNEKQVGRARARARARLAVNKKGLRLPTEQIESWKFLGQIIVGKVGYKRFSNKGENLAHHLDLSHHIHSSFHT